KLIDIDGLAGTGKLGGRIPLHWADGRLAVAGGALATTGPGRLSLARERLPSALTQAGEEVALALTALADFHYDSLSLTLDKDAG
ncbi:YdbH domain-containing protein, partial [Acinetobacter baumannii]